THFPANLAASRCTFWPFGPVTPFSTHRKRQESVTGRSWRLRGNRRAARVRVSARPDSISSRSWSESMCSSVDARKGWTSFVHRGKQSRNVGGQSNCLSAGQLLVRSVEHVRKAAGLADETLSFFFVAFDNFASNINHGPVSILLSVRYVD